MAEPACLGSLHLKPYPAAQGIKAGPSKLTLCFSVTEVCNRVGKYRVSKPVLTKFQQNDLKNTADTVLKVNISFKK